MKKIGILLVIFTLATTLGMSQPRERNFDPEKLAKRQTEQIKETVDLTGDQEKQVYALNIESGKKMRALREKMQDGGRAEGMREMVEKIRKEQNEKMKKILTEEQWGKYEEYLKERRARQERRSRRR
jgi:periplasmic protein CpxP/Spy